MREDMEPEQSTGPYSEADVEKQRRVLPALREALTPHDHGNGSKAKPFWSESCRMGYFAAGTAPAASPRWGSSDIQAGN